MTDDLDLTEDHERVRIDLGGYVLGNLTVAEQQAVESHLGSCAACRAELVELEGIPVLLDLARPDAVTPPPAVARPEPVVAIDRRRSGRSHRSSRRTRVFAGAAAALAIAAALVVGVLIGRPDQPDFGRTVPLQTAASASGTSGSGSGPTGTAAIRATENGTVVRLDLEGLPTDGRWYECTWSSGQGEQSAGTFRPAADGTANIDLTTAARPYPGWKLTIVEHPEGSADGEAVLEASA